MAYQATVILLCGIPASGKSTLARKVVTRLDRPGECSAIHLEYDALEDDLATDQLDPEGRIEAWRLARSLALQELESRICEWRDGSTDSLLILMDDNFHLRGMRKQVHRLLLKHKPIKFGLVWVKSSLDVCLERNRYRTRQIPEHVICRMNDTLEPPRATWESCWMKVVDSTVIDEVFDFITKCSEIQDLPDDVDLEQQAADRTKTELSQRHQWDKILRSWVGKTAKFDKKLARGANETRKYLLQKVKDPTSCIDSTSQLLRSFIDGVVAQSEITISSDQRSELERILTL